MKKKVSVIVPIYNAEKYLATCLNSIINQSYKDLEIILVNDGSIDDSSLICDSFSKKDNRIKVIHKENSGVSSSRNIGLKKATGNYILFIDADDYIELNCIEKCMDIINKYNLDILKFGYKKELGFYTKKNKFTVATDTKILKKDYNNFIYKYVLTTYDFSNIWNTLIKKEICKECYFDEKLTMGEDYLYVISCLEKSKNIYILSDHLYHYVINNNSITHNFNIDKNIKKLENVLIVGEKVKNILMKNGYDRYMEYIIQNKKNIEFNILNCIEKSNYREYCSYIDKVNGNKIFNNFLKNSQSMSSEFSNLLKKNRFNFYTIKIKLTLKNIIRFILSIIKINRSSL